MESTNYSNKQGKFIKVYNVFDMEFCEKTIEIFDKCEDIGITHYRNEPKRTIDTQLEINPSFQVIPDKDKSSIIDMRQQDISLMFFDILNKALEQYAEDLHWDIPTYSFRNMLVQKYNHLDIGGYHTFHSESSDSHSCDRFLVYTLYLNDIPVGEGETEFLYQGFRYQPKAGDLVIFPADFTHTHRGNPSTTVDKYIATGWVFHTPSDMFR